MTTQYSVHVVRGNIFVKYKNHTIALNLTPAELMELMPQLQKALNEVMKKD